MSISTPHCAPVMVLLASAAAAIAATAGPAAADFAPPPGTMVVSTAGCPGFAPDYPAFLDPIFHMDGFVDPAGPYLFVPESVVTIIRSSSTTETSVVSYTLRVEGTDASGGYSLFGTFHYRGMPRPPEGEGELRIAGPDGARMWGKGDVHTIAHRGDHLTLGFDGTPHCSASR